MTETVRLVLLIGFGLYLAWGIRAVALPALLHADDAYADYVAKCRSAGREVTSWGALLNGAALGASLVIETLLWPLYADD